MCVCVCVAKADQDKKEPCVTNVGMFKRRGEGVWRKGRKKKRLRGGLQRWKDGSKEAFYCRAFLLGLASLCTHTHTYRKLVPNSERVRTDVDGHSSNQEPGSPRSFSASCFQLPSNAGANDTLGNWDEMSKISDADMRRPRLLLLIPSHSHFEFLWSPHKSARVALFLQLLRGRQVDR